MVIYQTLPRLFGNKQAPAKPDGSLAENGVGKFADYTGQVLSTIKELGVTHVWFTGAIAHATQTNYTAYGIRPDHPSVVKGKAGSPYAIRDYYDVDPDLAVEVDNRMQEFEALIARTHAAGMKVIIDFVPNHVSREYYSQAKPLGVNDLGEKDNTAVAFDPNNNFYYIPGQSLHLGFVDSDYSEFPAKVTGNDCFDATPSHNDWYETIKLNYGVDYLGGRTAHFDPVPDTWKKMRDILFYWSEKQVDGFRCDMAEMVPVEFWGWMIPQVKQHREALFIAEVYNPSEYENYLHQGHFDYLYNKVNLYDTLRDVICGCMPARNISYAWQFNEGIQPYLLNFLENHDEQRIASDFFIGNPQAAIPGMVVCATMNVGPVMIYNGQELGERGMDSEGFSGRDGRTTIFDYWSMETVRNWSSGGAFDTSLRRQYQQILTLAHTEQAFSKGTFFDLMYVNLESGRFNFQKIYAYLRGYEKEVILVVANFDGVAQHAEVMIPPVAFEMLGIEENQGAEVTELLTGEKSIAALVSFSPYVVDVPAYGAKLLKFAY